MKRKAGKSEMPTISGSSVKPAKSAGRLDRNVQAKIGQQLRAVYEEVIKEGVPDRFAEFLRRLEDKRDPEAEQ
jgi:hypothetical protein